MPQVLNMPKFWTWQSSEYGSVFNMRALHSALNMSEYTFTEKSSENILGSKHTRILKIAGFWICKSYTVFKICHNMAEYVWVDVSMPGYVWIYNNRQGSESVSYNT